jgi:peptidyl-prolyl cis-trans isomerase D
VEKGYRKSKSAERYEEQLEILRTSAFENDGSLDPSSKAINSAIKHTEFFSRQGGEGVAAKPAVIEAAFREEVVSQGVNSSLIEISRSHALVLRLDEHKKPQQKPLADVRDVIIKQLKKEEGKKLVKEKGDALLPSIKAAGNWDSLGDAAKSVEKHAGVSRNDPNVMPFITSKVFQLSEPKAGKSVYTTIENPNGDYSIVALTAVKKGEEKLDEAAISQYSSYIGNRIQTATLRAMRERADIETFPERLNRE